MSFEEAVTQFCRDESLFGKPELNYKNANCRKTVCLIVTQIAVGRTSSANDEKTA